MTFVAITIQNFKDYFLRDFPYGPDIEQNVLDEDLTRALDESFAEIPQGLFSDQADFEIGLKYLMAHFLVLNLQNSSQGLSGQYEWLTSSKSVGSVSSSFAVPEGVSNNAQLSHFAKTNYGARYISIIWPRRIGQIFTVGGRTQA